MPPIILKYKNYLIIGLVVIAGGFVAMAVLGGGDAAPPEGNVAATESESAQIERELLDELLRLRSIELNETLFANPLFLSLVDFSKPLVEQPVGRSNPFSPIEAGNAPAGTPAPAP